MCIRDSYYRIGRLIRVGVKLPDRQAAAQQAELGQQRPLAIVERKWVAEHMRGVDGEEDQLRADQQPKHAEQAPRCQPAEQAQPGVWTRAWLEV